ncbi:MAG: NAD-glutamate dehydrogenase, partial [Acetobacteraceae bacterium]|nr:NAD-glutamate dehydrogenase [Acetobacteraceae bacterium]
DAAAAPLRETGLPAELAALVAAAPRLAAAPAIVRLADMAGVPPAEAAAAWSATGEAFALDALRAATAALRATGAFGARAKAALLDDLTASQMRLALARLRGQAPDPERAAAAARLAREAAGAEDLAAVTVASRALAALA